MRACPIAMFCSYYLVIFEEAADLHLKGIVRTDAVSLAFFNVCANLNTDDKEHHASAESCMKPQKVMPAYHDSFKRDRPAIIEP